MNESKMYIKVQLEMRGDKGGLCVKIQFDPSAPNITIQGNNEISWHPTYEEVKFINQVFSLVYSKSMDFDTKYRQVPDARVDSEGSTSTPLSAEHYSKADTVQEESSDKKKGDGLLVSADAETIDQIIKKKKEGEGVILEADENTIVDRVLKKKKREGW
ncbi:MAG: hypothetical protein QXS02_04980 [Candidatus Thermoplasmatota archaeon]